MQQIGIFLIFSTAAALLTVTYAAAPYYGTKIGSFQTHVHGVVGNVFAVDERTVFIKDFSYDGQGPDAYFWGGTTSKPDSSGFIIPDEKGKKTPLKEYQNKDLLLRLPAGKTLRNIKWLAVWCRKFNANFGDLHIPSNLAIPQPIEIGRIPTKEHGVSSGPVMVVDTQTLLVPEFTYDGLGPAAYWWVSRGSRQHPRGMRMADENGSFAPLPKYTGRTVVITLPDEFTIYDFDWFGVWCEEAQVDFGSVALPQDIVVPPSPRKLGIELEYKLNCEVLRDDLGYEVRWIMDGEDIVMQLVAKLEPGEYMAFGLSKNDSNSDMDNADAIVAFTDKKKKGHAVDYFLGNKEQCVGSRGSCPDTKFPDGQDSVTLLNAAVVNGYTMITVKRPQVGLDEKYDQHVYSDGPQAVVWAVGLLNDKKEVSYHSSMRSEGDIFIDFARPPQWNCPQPGEPEYSPESPPTTTTTTPAPTTKRPSSSDRGRKPKPTSETFRRKPQPIGPRYTSRAVDVGRTALNVNPDWNIPSIMCPADRTFRAQMGPTGGKKGYQSITGDVGWGIAWYINGALIPEITLERGKTYTFIVEGGNDPENSARTHPFYITDDPEGGYRFKTAAEKKKANIYAGATKDRRGNVSPTAMGRLCEWKMPKDVTADDFGTFEEFQESLELKCERGKPGRLTFKPDQDTPDELYYQCFTHRFLGWKIHVVDSCDDKGLRHEASIQHVRNITYNTFESDYRRGGDKKKLSSAEDESDNYSPKYFGGNDGIPLELSETDVNRKNEDKISSFDDQDSQKDLYYKPTSSVYYSSPNYYYSTSISDTSDLYYKPTTSGYKKYFQTTPESKSHYYKSSTTRTPSTRKSNYGPNIKTNTPTMEPFRIRDVIHTSGPRGYYYPSQTTTVKPSTSYKTALVSPGQTAPLKLRIYVSTQKPKVNPTKAPYPGTTRSKNQWWNNPTPPSTNRQHAINSLRSQLSVVQAPRQEGRPSSTRLTHVPQANVHYEQSFIPVVIKNNGSFDTIVARAPSHPHNPGNPAGHILALSSTIYNGKNIVPVLIRAKEPVRRTIGNSNKNGIHTPLGRLPYPNTSSRKNTQNYKSRQPGGESYLPLLVPHNKNRTTNSKKNVAPLIPLVVPEKKDDNLYILHQMLSLLNENPQSIAARGIKIVGSDKDRNIRTRVVRSADHHHDHKSHGHKDHNQSSHEHEDHDHDNKGHDCHREDSKKSSGNVFVLSTFLLLSILSLTFWKVVKQN